GRTEAARTEQQHLRLEQLLLAFLTDFGEQEVPGVAVALLGVEHSRRDPVAPFVLPAAEAAGHRRNVGVAELLQRARRERGAVTRRAVDDDGRVAVGELVLRLR